jgi:hypothetical protein
MHGICKQAPDVQQSCHTGSGTAADQGWSLVLDKVCVIASGSLMLYSDTLWSRPELGTYIQ